MKAVAVVGNPKAASRTREAAERLVAALGLDCEVLEVSELGAGLLSWDAPEVTAAVERVRAADVVIAASPTYKGTCTGLLKLFLDRFPTDTGLAGQVAAQLDSTCTTDGSLARRTGRRGRTVLDAAKARTAR